MLHYTSPSIISATRPMKIRMASHSAYRQPRLPLTSRCAILKRMWSARRRLEEKGEIDDFWVEDYGRIIGIATGNPQTKEKPAHDRLGYGRCCRFPRHIFRPKKNRNHLPFHFLLCDSWPSTFFCVRVDDVTTKGITIHVTIDQLFRLATIVRLWCYL